ncbi:MAG: 16S rRNA (adenine(1518)-N(6)/adenine(1519)-N(6))-dimethyltransferase RsmA [Clostridia bacterium]|nr:16S rRNA (adenine(1518)-N(6)/adenine(1519)-N(6))-dimethyltransferase RsmA [Clostridia bacterium]
MYSLTDKKTIDYLCNKYGFRLKKSLGQNFLNEPEVLVTIADSVEADGVLEIGPGIGVLTAALASCKQKVVSVEIDDTLLPVLDETLAGFNNIEIIHSDILKLDLPALLKEKFGDMSVSVAANLPYYITTPIIMNLLEQRLPLSEIVIMIQKEVADRITAAPGSKDYGALTLAVNYFCRAEKVCDVDKSCFTPAPKVDSTVLRLEVLDTPSVAVKNERRFFAIIKAAFGQRRKTLANALSNAGLFGSKDEIYAAFEKLGFDPMIRGEKLSIEEFAKLSDI